MKLNVFWLGFDVDVFEDEFLEVIVYWVLFIWLFYKVLIC